MLDRFEAIVGTCLDQGVATDENIQKRMLLARPAQRYEYLKHNYLLAPVATRPTLIVLKAQLRDIDAEFQKLNVGGGKQKAARRVQQREHTAKVATEAASADEAIAEDRPIEEDADPAVAAAVETTVELVAPTKRRSSSSAAEAKAISGRTARRKIRSVASATKWDILRLCGRQRATESNWRIQEAT